MVGDLGRLLSDSIWLWLLCGLAFWAFLGFVVASKLGANIWIGMIAGGLGSILGLLAVYLWVRARGTGPGPATSGSAQVGAATSGSTSPFPTSAGLASSWDDSSEWDPVLESQPGRPVIDRPGQREQLRGRTKLLPGVLGLAAAAVLLTALLNEWLNIDVSGPLYSRFYGDQSLWTVLPVLVSAVGIVACVVLFTGTGHRRWLVVAATLSLPWLFLGVEIIDSAVSLTLISQHVLSEKQVSSSSGIYPGAGLVLLAVGGALGFAWAVWMAVGVHRGVAPVRTARQHSARPGSAPISSSAPSYRPLGGEDW